jgi:ligand-binding SRPBCC domain-containing protein
MTHELIRSQLIPRPREQVFAFFAQPANLARLTPPWLGFTIATPGPLTMGRGAVFEYRIRVLGVPLRWTTLIDGCQPPRAFSDRQVRGPYAFWHHRHEFLEAPGGTLMLDSVRYRLPLGPLGELARALWVRRSLDEIFDYRARAVRELFPRRPQEARG